MSPTPSKLNSSNLNQIKSDDYDENSSDSSEIPSLLDYSPSDSEISRTKSTSSPMSKPTTTDESTQTTGLGISDETHASPLPGAPSSVGAEVTRGGAANASVESEIGSTASPKSGKGVRWVKKLIGRADGDKDDSSLEDEPVGGVVPLVLVPSRSGSVVSVPGDQHPASLDDTLLRHDRGVPSVGGAESISGVSLKDQLMDQHSPDPSTSNDKFHELFPQIPEEEEIIEDYRVAIQKDILVQGRLYVTEVRLAFRANILGWETVVVVPWADVVSIEKRMTAVVIPNAIEVATAGQKHTFSSFLHRDAAFDLLVAVWKHSRPQDASSIVTDGDRRSVMSYTNDQGDKKKFKFKNLPIVAKLKSIRGNDDSDSDDELTPAQKVKASAMTDGEGGGHPPTQYDGPEYKDVALDIVLPTSPELAYGLMFTDKEFLTNFLVENQKVKELEMEDWTEGEQPERKMHYIKPLNGSIGPKETLCNIDDVNEKSDPEAYYTTVSTTQTPDVPSGSNFCTKTRTVITWSETGGAHVKVTTEVEWSKVNRMLKGIIERSCLDGQKTYQKDLEAAVREHIGANKSKFAVAGASESEALATVESTDSDSSVLATVASYLPSALTLLSVLVVVLLITNFWTLVALRQHARALHAARLGSPDEVSSAVSRVLEQFSSAHEKAAHRGAGVGRELEAVKSMAAALERQAGQLKDRLSGF